MNKIVIMVALALFITATAISASAQGTTPAKPADKPAYDADLAKKLGADERGMKLYVFVILKRGLKKIDDAKIRQDLINGHMTNIGRLADEGKLVLAGPFEGKQDMRGIYIFDVPTIDEAKLLVDTDPAVKGGLFDVEYYQWYVSAAINELPQIHKRLQKPKAAQ
ncbi:MAG: YciI family protein [Pyrinomonadaceae bacterium]